jgi:hypothetical protein
LFGGNQKDIVPAKLRQFQSISQEDCKIYITEVKKYWRTHNIAGSINELDSKRVAKEVIQMEWEKLDWDIRAMQLGEKAVKKPTGQHSWSRQLRKAAYTHQYWKKE